MFLPSIGIDDPKEFIHFKKNINDELPLNILHTVIGPILLTIFHILIKLDFFFKLFMFNYSIMRLIIECNSSIFNLKSL